jgi:DNA-binding XRE family transcriptional regulator
MVFKKLDGEIMADIGRDLKSLRKSHGYNQQDLADKIGISRKLVVDIEAGRGTSLLVFVKLLRVFGKEDGLNDLLEPRMTSPKELFEKSQQ